MSAKRKTSAEYAEDVKKAEARVRELKRKAAEATKAEKAKADVELLEAVKAWAEVNGHSTDSAELADYFKRLKVKAEQKKAAQMQTQQTGTAGQSWL